jgi:hypothetical protein
MDHSNSVQDAESQPSLFLEVHNLGVVDVRKNPETEPVPWTSKQDVTTNTLDPAPSTKAVTKYFRPSLVNKEEIKSSLSSLNHIYICSYNFFTIFVEQSLENLRINSENFLYIYFLRKILVKVQTMVCFYLATIYF